jgi:quercetin dioxygenase-like cupin family protein
MKSILLITACFFFHHAAAQQHVAPAGNAEPTQVCSAALVWNETRPPLLPGAQVAVVDGNPKAEGHFTIRLKFPPYYKIPPHTHPVDERTTVLSGAISIGFGDVFDTVNVVRLTPGCFYRNPAGVHHYFFTSEAETEIQVSTNGPWGLDLIKK